MFDHIGLEQRVREMVAENASLRRKAAIWTAACAAVAVGTIFCAWAAVWTAADAAALAAMLASGAAAASGVSSYWGWRRVRQMDGRIVGTVSAFAERAVEARLEAGREPRARDADARIRDRVNVNGPPGGDPSTPLPLPTRA